MVVDSPKWPLQNSDNVVNRKVETNSKPDLTKHPVKARYARDVRRWDVGGGQLRRRAQLAASGRTDGRQTDEKGEQNECDTNTDSRSDERVRCWTVDYDVYTFVMFT